MACSSSIGGLSMAVLILCVTPVSAQYLRQKPAVPTKPQPRTVQKTTPLKGNIISMGGGSNMLASPSSPAPPPETATHPDAQLPDLIVSDIFLDRGEIKFKVKNIGQGFKPASVRVNFAFVVWSPSRNWYLPGFDSASEYIAVRTSANQIGPGQELVESTGVRAGGCSPRASGRVDGKPGLGNDDPGPGLRCLEIDEPAAQLEVTINSFFLHPGETSSLRESNLNNNQLTKYWAQMIGQAADLEVLSGYVEFGDASTGTAHFRVRNNGNVPARNVRVRLAVTDHFYSNPLPFDNVYLRIDPGDDGDFQVLFHLPFDAESRVYCCKYTAILDPENSVIESRKDNNQLLLTDVRFPRADLLIDFADFSYFEEAEVQAAIFVRNAGNKTAPQFSVEMIVDNGARTLSARGTIPGLNPGERDSVNLRIDHLPHDFWATSGCCVAIAVADPDNLIQESNKNNNRKVVHDSRPPKPALR